MYSLSVRFNKIFFYGCVNLAILCTLNYLTGVYQVKDKTIDTDFKFISHYYFQPFRKRISSSVTADWEVLVSTFSLKVKNLKNIENWNLKQLFFYLEMVWDENAVFWDKIMPRKKLRDFYMKKEKFKYQITDVNKNLRGKKVTVNLIIEFIPVFGWIHRVLQKEKIWKF